ncbi:MAG: undecaprenyl-diphosphate phosphatase [Dehalococcoidia bacterium]|nr:undecaprenyl-diphosphate phosphatase [Dehalococcoidia bacterium]
MSLIQAIILGIVQGLTEFLPISSSGHLILVPYFFDWDPQTLTFDLALHAGTLIAVALYFRGDWIRMTRATTLDLRARDLSSVETRLFLLLVIGSIPAVLAGAYLSSVEDTLRTPAVVAAMLVLVAGVMWLAESMGEQRRHLDDLERKDAWIIGAGQALALVPGVSRSGITIAAGLFRHLDREAATRFSFLLSTPVIFGAVLLGFLDARASGESIEVAPFLAGGVTAALAGFTAIHFLLRYLRFNSLRIFISYRLGLAAVFLIVAIVR